MEIILMRARLTATTGLVIFPAEFLSAPARGFMAFTDARASMAALGFMVGQASTVVLGITVAAISMTAGIATSDAGTMAMASVVATSEAVAIEENSETGTSEAATNEENSMAAAASMVEAVSTVAGEGSFHFLAASKSPTRQSPAKAAG
jgi:hypothetical protein